MSFSKSVHGFSREMELRQAKDQGVAIMIERDSAPTGYAPGIVFLIIQLQSQTESMKILIANASVIRGPGFLVLQGTMNYFIGYSKMVFKYGGLQIS